MQKLGPLYSPLEVCGYFSNLIDLLELADGMLDSRLVLCLHTHISPPRYAVNCNSFLRYGLLLVSWLYEIGGD